MDRQARKLAGRNVPGGGEEGAVSDVGSEVGSNTDSDSDEKVGITISSFFHIMLYIYFFLMNLLFLCILYSYQDASLTSSYRILRNYVGIKYL